MYMIDAEVAAINEAKPMYGANNVKWLVGIQIPPTGGRGFAAAIA